MQVQEPEQRNSLHISARQSLEASESSPIVNASDADDQEIELEPPGRRHESTLDELPPSLGVKLTGYRLLHMSVVFSFGMIKAILTYMGRSAMPTTLDWIGGAFLAVVLYWVGLYEPECSKKWEWFFQVDLTRAICYCVLRFTGGVLGVLFAIRGSLAITSLSSIPVFLLAYFLPGVPRDLWFGIYVMFTVCVHLTWLRMRRRLWRRARIRQGVMGFLDDYGLSASLPEKYRSNTSGPVRWASHWDSTAGQLLSVRHSPLFTFLSKVQNAILNQLALDAMELFMKHSPATVRQRVKRPHVMRKRRTRQYIAITSDSEHTMYVQYTPHDGDLGIHSFLSLYRDHG